MDSRDLDKSSAKIFGWFKRNAVSLVLFFISIYFIFSGTFKFVVNEMDWYSKICYVASNLVFGVSISSLVGETGYQTAKNTAEFQETRAQAIELCEKALPKHKEVELYVSKLIDDDIRQERFEILNKASIWYDEVFKDDKCVIDLKELKRKKEFSRKQKRAIKQAIRIKKVPFTLFGFSSVKTVGRKEAPSESRRRNRKILTDLLGRVFIALISGTVMVSFVGISVSSIIYACFQLLIWFGSGFLSRTRNYNFILNEVREYDKDRIWYLKKFLSLSEDEVNALTIEIAEKEAARKKIKLIESK